MTTVLGRVAPIALWLACAGAAASPITYDFTVTASDGPLAGTVAQGDFTFDSSSITPGAVNGATGLLTTLHFAWNGIVYNAGTANTGALAFDATGNLLSALFGTQCNPGFCSGSAGIEGWTVSAPGIFFYTPAGFDVGSTGTVTLSLAVPEPGMLGLLGAALATLAFSRLRRYPRRGTVSDRAPGST